MQSPSDPVDLMPVQVAETADSTMLNAYAENSDKCTNIDLHFDEEKKEAPPDDSQAWYLQKYPLELIFPIRFEDGMSYEECEKYYCLLYPDRNICHREAIPQKRITSKWELEQEASGQLRSCLRRSKFAFTMATTRTVDQPPKRQLRRYVSFSNITTASSSSFLSNSKFSITRSWQSMRQVSGNICVSFDKYVHVVTVFPFHEYPKEIWSSLWYAREEFARSVKKAHKEHRREERQRAAIQRQLEEEELTIDCLREDKSTTNYDTLSCASTYDQKNCSSDFEGVYTDISLSDWPRAQVEGMETILIS